ncbi:uncharacterized protein LOC106091686 [Stomoxys calcitrans]|uniref:uncharacterized protein LOC106091686 n=1 Tax=Stomoxys calcitrans TaxID=35570 RepID=UPI0027E2CC5A|nr:uncharacterized protein LOC106091686 [Stomoxys calcitrans]
MAKKGGNPKDKAQKGKSKAKSPQEKPIEIPLEKEESIPEEPKKVEKEPVVPKIEIEEPCVVNCSQETVTYRPNSYPGLLKHPKTMSVVGSECGSYDSLCKLIHAAFRCADRIYLMVPWGNYVIFRWQNFSKINYFIFDGCTCNVNRFRYMDLTCGTAGLLYFEEMHKVINYVIMSRQRREEIKRLKRCIIDDVCKEMYGDQHI